MGQETSKILVVDDGSKDNTYKVAKKYNAFVLRHTVNLGKGAALKTGCDFAIKNNIKFKKCMNCNFSSINK